jgi:alpha-beta hydrolase superfamily lysophospholipase
MDKERTLASQAGARRSSSARRINASLLAALALLAGAFARPVALHYFAPKFLTYGPNGPETPASVGLRYERVRIPSGHRQLDAYLVSAEPACQPRTALLIFHGVGETISQWVQAQRFLYDHCVSSLVFDYSGYGDSSKPGTIDNVNQDAVAAYSYFALRFADGNRLCVLGHSLGDAPMLQEIPHSRPAPACVVVANGFSAFRELHSSRFISYVVPGVWDNVRSVARIHVPLLVVHSDADAVLPLSMAQRVFEAASEPKRMVVLHGFPHDALFTNPSEEWWNPVLAFLRESAAVP